MRRIAATVTGLLLLTTAAAGDIDPRELLDRMNEAVRDLDYEGRFVVQSGSQLDAMYIVHRVDEGAEKERVVSLTGQPREIIRSGEAVACLTPGSDRHINVGRREHGRTVSPLRGVSAEQLERFYRMQLLEPERVAGREAHQLLIEPSDDLRFGYRLFIDKQSDLPLRSMMLDTDRQVVSQMMFTELRVNRGITPIERDLSAMQLARPETDVLQLHYQRLSPPAWTFSDLPAGFHLNAHRRTPLPSSDGVREHFIFTDGLATVSVYVQPADGTATLPGASRLGSANAVGRLVADHEVIAVGEVPTKTLQLFAERLQAAER
ncbi:MAG: MucB/RseB C-terminal domain-containing protein [Gammaproteobacteria bacterium]|nr:MucB/RseB C-terminal domain-containing protein [Gammaproteobacteria bacterium]